jgi:predicted O-methyltransferase YrrM
MNPYLEEVYRTGRCEDAEGNSINPFTASIPYDDGMILYQIVREKRATRTLETGMAYGMSTLFMCQGLVDNGGGHHVAIDPEASTTWKSVGMVNVRKAGFHPMVSLYEAPSFKTLPRLLADGEQFDVVFIDGLHLFDAVLLDFCYADRLLNPGGYIVFHDTFMPSVRKSLAFIRRNTSYKPVEKFHGKPARFWRWCRVTLTNFLESPLDIYASIFLRREHFKPNLFVIEKTAEDNRVWDHYRSF